MRTTPWYPVIIADSLTNDFMGSGAAFQESRVHIGQREVERLLGSGEGVGNGVLPTFLRQAVAARQAGQPLGVVLVRDCHDPADPQQQPELVRYGRHNLLGEEGAEFIPAIHPLLPFVEILETTTLSLPLDRLRQVMEKLLGRDFLAMTPAERQRVCFILVGCHTDKRILGTANLLRNVLGFSRVAVSPHLVGSSNHEAHLAALQGGLPDALVQVFPDLLDLLCLAGLEPEPFGHFDCRGAALLPASLVATLTPDQKNILDLAFLRFSQVTLTPMAGGFSGSLLLLAHRRFVGVEAAPVVVKIDRHPAIQRELEGYDRVKAIFGGQVPSFGPPVSAGGHTGIVMEFASRSGAPRTLQSLFEGVADAAAGERFLKNLTGALLLLQERLYRPTLRRCRFSPWQQFGLHAPQQWIWLLDNIRHIVGESWQEGEMGLVPGVVLGDFMPLFQTLTRDPAWLPGMVCLGHGDMNLANIILDDLDNIWFIDWTHSAQVPVEQDLAKLENDLKFVVSKKFTEEELPVLMALEKFLLDHLLLPPLSEAAEVVPLLAVDVRFRLVYRAVAAIRQVYVALHSEQDATVYQIALLRYATHTLSFDARRGRGECSLGQLRHALVSVQLLVERLAVSDFHRLTSAARPDSYPERQRLPRELAPWSQPCPDYHPPRHVDPLVLTSDWADAEEMAAQPGLRERLVAAATRLDEAGFPLNPAGRTGLRGRGVLGRWGGNLAVDPVITRVNPDNRRLELLLGRRRDTGELSLPGGIVLAGETVAQALARCLRDKAGVTLDMAAGLEIYRGYVEDFRNTDQAWLESCAWSWHLTGQAARELRFRGGGGMTEMGWMGIAPGVVRALFASHAELVRCALRQRVACREADADLMREWLLVV